MAKFRAKNEGQSAFYQAAYRLKYKNEAFPQNNSLGPIGVVDFLFGERNLYGRVDQNLNVVIPNGDALSRITTKNNPTGIVAMNFVIDQFQEFLRTYETALNSRKIRQDDPFLSTIEVYRSYENPKVLYENYFEEIFRICFQVVIPSLKSL